MKRGAKILAPLIVLAILFGIAYQHRAEIPGSVLSHFRNLKEVELCSIRTYQLTSSTPNGLIDDYPIRGMAKIDDHKLLLKKLLQADRMNNSTSALCFNPRHAFRDPNNHDNWILICFECFQGIYSCNGKTGGFLLSEYPEETFNEKMAHRQRV